MGDSIQSAIAATSVYWAIEAAKQIVSEQGSELAREARDGAEDARSRS
nr:hypothetical protein REQ54_04364 [Rhizobium sp. Q54]